jgi:lipase chaperone LimK
MKNRAKPIGLVAAAVIAAAALYQYQSDNSDGVAAMDATQAAVQSSGNTFAASFVGTQIDGQLLAKGGQLELSEALIARFDYYLAAVGERPLPQIYAEIERSINTELALSPAAAAEAKRIFGTYIEFKGATKSLPAVSADDPAPLQAIRNRFEAERALRARHFTAQEVAALFGSVDFSADDALARTEIKGNQQLTEAQKQAQLAQLDAHLPPEVRAWRAPQASVDALEAAEKVARARGASAAEMLAMRTNLVGSEAARNLAALDAENAAWDQRVQAFKTEKYAILANAALQEPERLASLDRLRERDFKPNELFLLHASEQ